MQNTRIVKRPEYAIDSVDNALQLLLMLQERESLRLADAARELGVARSTAHRLLQTLAYRGFVLQDDQRRYCPGPNLKHDAAHSPMRTTAAVARPRLETLAAQSRETVNLIERIGTTVRFLTTVEGPQLLRIGDRTGSILPARTSAGGKAALAALPPAAVQQLYTGRGGRGENQRLTAEGLRELLAELEATRTRGYSLNLGRTEPELAAIGAAIPVPGRPPTLAVSLSAPISRAEQLQDPQTVACMLEACVGLAQDLA